MLGRFSLLILDLEHTAVCVRGQFIYRHIIKLIVVDNAGLCFHSQILVFISVARIYQKQVEEKKQNKK